MYKIQTIIDGDKLNELTVTDIDVIVDSTSVKCVISVQDDFGTSEYQVGVDDHIIRRWKLALLRKEQGV